jgi:hypothetical protein
MTRIATNVPAENDLLCEHCGYTLNGLPSGGRCPECGTPMADSIGTTRVAPAWETANSGRFVAWISTSLAVIFHPTRFYRTLTTRGELGPAARFARWHWMVSAILFGITAYVHSGWDWRTSYPHISLVMTRWMLAGLALFGTFFLLEWVTRLAAKLTNWEATYRGLRLPMQVVRRGMYYHAAHYLPVALMALITVVGYRVLYDLRILSIETLVAYIWVIAGEVIVGAIYLFQTYWIAMRNMMYANR